MHKNILKHIKNLSDSNETKRRLSAEALSQGDERVIYPLIKALRDSSAGVQDAAMRSLIAIGGETTAYMVLPLLREDAFLRNTAMIILKEIGKDTVPLLRNLLRDKDDDVRKFAIDLLIEINHCDYPDDIVYLLKSDKNLNVRASAAKALGVFKYAKAIPDLIEALKDNEWVCFSALEALSHFKEESTVEAIASLLNSESETLVIHAIETLGMLGFSKAERYLIKHYPLANRIQKEAIIKSLISIGSTPELPGATEILMDIYINGDWQERLIALKGLVALKDTTNLRVILDIAGSLDPSIPQDLDILNNVKQILIGYDCVKPLLDVLLDKEMKYRAKTLVIEIIEDQRCHEAIPYLIKLYEENLRDIKRASIRALGEIGDKETDYVLLDASENEDGHVRKNAISAIGRVGDRTVLTKLLELLEKEVYKDVMEEIIKAINTIDITVLQQKLGTFKPSIRELIARHTKDIDTLDTLSSDPDLNVRLSAISTLGRINNERAVEILKGFLQDKNAQVRKTALMSLQDKRCCIEDILPMLDDVDLWVRIYAVKALGNSLDLKVAEKIKGLLSSPEIPLVSVAMDALHQIASYHKIDTREVFKSLSEHKVPSIKNRAKEMLRIYESTE